jgi:hypothetical protein
VPQISLDPPNYMRDLMRSGHAARR